MVSEWFFIALIVAAFLWLMVETKWLTVRLVQWSVDITKLIPIVQAAAILIGVLSFIMVDESVFDYCKIHGTRYPKDTECPDCMKEQDAAMDAKKEKME